MELRKHPIRRIGVDANLFLGGDRRLVMFSGWLSCILVFAIGNRWAALAGIVLWFSSLYALRELAKADPQIREIYLQSLHYHRYYPAESTPFRSSPWWRALALWLPSWGSSRGPYHW